MIHKAVASHRVDDYQSHHKEEMLRAGDMNAKSNEEKAMDKLNNPRGGDKGQDSLEAHGHDRGGSLTASCIQFFRQLF